MCQQTATVEMIEAPAHPFEAAGLGKAPFRCIGIVEKVCSGQPNANGITIGAAGQPAGTCDYCGMGIRYCCQIVSADRKQFVVGCDCVMKLERESNSADRKLVAVVTNYKKQQAKAARETRKVIERARIEAAREILADNPEQFANRPHPSIQGKTLADYLGWMFKNAGHTGQLAAAKIVAQG